MARNEDRYKWDVDSRDARQSEFAHSGYSTSTISAFPSARARLLSARKRRARVFAVAWPLLTAAGVSTLLLYAIVSHLRG
jgi:hypothetical protein